MAAVLDAVTGFLAPPPLSPLFQPEGALAFLRNEDVGFMLIAMSCFFVLDFLIVQKVFVPKARYFALHVVCNAVSAYFSFPDVRRAVTEDPWTAFTGASCGMVANSTVAALHIYHCLAFKLSGADIFHHAVFVTILCGLAIPYKHTGGVANNFGCFFLSGLPGGMDYVLLVLMQHGLIDKITEKKWNAVINVWLRGPSMSIYLFLGWMTWWFHS